MRRSFGFFGLCSMIFCSAIAYTGQEEQPTAEHVFKNIVSFKGEKASDVIPAMHFMSASLNVKCDYCHTDDRASDEKEEKKTARAMIAMQRDINQKNFNGRNQVTCATCHAGHTHPVGMPPVTGLADRVRRSRDVTPDQVLATYAKLFSDSSAAPSGLRLTGTSLENGEKSKLEATYLGDKLTVSTHGTKADQKMGFDGTMAWFAMPDGVHKVPLAMAVQYVNQERVFTGPASLPKLSNPTAGTAKVGAKDMLVVTGVAEDKTRVSLFFDKQTGQLARVGYYYPTILGSIAQFNDFSNYRKIGGVLLPTTIVRHSSDGDVVQQISGGKFDSTIAASAFDAPAK